MSFDDLSYLSLMSLKLEALSTLALRLFWPSTRAIQQLYSAEHLFPGTQSHHLHLAITGCLGKAWMTLTLPRDQSFPVNHSLMKA